MKTAIVLALFLLMPGTVFSETFIVPDDYPTIQEAIDASTYDDTILVHPDTYTENLVIDFTRVTLRSTDGPLVTVIDGGQNGSVVSIKNCGVPNGSVLDGFTITNGLSLYGGGVHNSTDPNIIINNIIHGNSAVFGGGIATISGFYNQVITGNIIYGNSSEYGGGIYCGGTRSIITNNIVRCNTASQKGGGLYNDSYSYGTPPPTLRNNTFYGNTAPLGGGIYCYSIHDLTFNCEILWNNNASEGPQIYFTTHWTYTPTLSLIFSNIQGGPSLIHVDPECTLDWGDGMIAEYPMFFNPLANDFRLAQDPCQPGLSNPCVDTGDPNLPIIDGSTRTDGEPDKGVIDMGYHYTLGTELRVPQQYLTIQSAIDVAKERDVVIVAPGTYRENIDFLGKRITVTSQRGPEVTTIDGMRTGSVVSFTNGETNASVFRGFTVTNGSGTEKYLTYRGGGIYCENASPTIEENVIIDNHTLPTHFPSYGGGIYLTSPATVRNNQIRKNRASYGGGTYIDSSDFVIFENNLLEDNWAKISGGAMTLKDSKIALSQCTITNNVFSDPFQGTTGGIYIIGSSTGMINNTIIWNNIGTELNTQHSTFPAGQVFYCDIQGGWPASPATNLNKDPLFIDPSKGGNFHLKQHPCQPGINNPLVDAGNPNTQFLIGSTRVDHYPDTGTVDLGYHYSDYPLSGCRRVPGEYQSIQAAIIAAVEGDLILVAPGSYVENIDFLGKDLTVRSDLDGSPYTRDIAPEHTIIDGGGNGPVAIFNQQETLGAVLEGFTLTNGHTLGHGGGILCYNGSSPLIRHNIVYGNTAGERGGGVACGESSLAQLVGNIIIENFAKYGGGVHSFTSDILISGNTLYGNTASVVGGGVELDESSPLIINSILWENSAPTGSQIRLGGSSNPDIKFCNIQGGCSAGINILDADPLFEDPATHDFHLKQRSPCINRGSSIYLSTTDIDGESRPCMGSADIGADEYSGDHLLTISGPEECSWPNNYATATSELWPPSNAIDGNPSSCWSSNFYPVPEAYEHLEFWFTPSRLVNTVRLLPRYSGDESLSFPRNFTFYFYDGLDWVEALSVSDYPNPSGGGWEEFIFPTTVETSAIRVASSVLGQDDGGGFIFQLGEVEAGYSSLFTLSESTGGTVDFHLEAGLSNAGRTYVVLGGVSGTIPGLTLPGGHSILPINWDIVTNIVWIFLNTPYFPGFYGKLDAQGRADAQFNTLGPMDPGSEGYLNQFAFCLGWPWEFVSNPVAVKIMP